MFYYSQANEPSPRQAPACRQAQRNRYFKNKNMPLKFKKITVIILIVSGLLIFLGIIEIQILKLKKIVSISQQNISDQTKTAAQTKSAKYNYNTYSIVGKSLISHKPDGTTEVAVADLEKDGVKNGICGSFDAVSILAQPEFNKYLFLVDGCGEMGGTVWSFHIPTKTIKKLKHGFLYGTTDPSPRGDFQVVLGEPDDDGEIRKLSIIDFTNDEQWETSPLPKHLTYLQGIGEGYGLPLSDIRWNNVDSARAKVFLANVPYNMFFASRESVLDIGVPLNKSDTSQ